MSLKDVNGQIAINGVKYNFNATCTVQSIVTETQNHKDCDLCEREYIEKVPWLPVCIKVAHINGEPVCEKEIVNQVYDWIVENRMSFAFGGHWTGWGGV